MAPIRKAALTVLLLIALTACGTEPGSSTATPEEAGALASATPTPAAAGGGRDDERATLVAHSVRLHLGPDKGSERIRMLVNPDNPQLRVTLAGPIDQDERAVTVCVVTDETSVPPSTQCVIPVAERPVDLPDVPRARGVEIALAGRATEVTLDAISIAYVPVDRRVKILLPTLDPPAADAPCLPRGCPAFEVTPARAGELAATASWAEPGGGLLDVRTALPLPTAPISPTPAAFRVLSSSTSSSNAGPGSVSVEATVREDQESFLAFTTSGPGPLPAPVIEATWP